MQSVGPLKCPLTQPLNGYKPLQREGWGRAVPGYHLQPSKLAPLTGRATVSEAAAEVSWPTDKEENGNEGCRTVVRAFTTQGCSAKAATGG
jgi:hypothetical protein